MHFHQPHESVDEDIVAFGPFQLNRTERALSKAGVAIPMRSRAMGILLALTEKAGVIVSQRELLRRVWPNRVVESGAIRVHVSQLRRLLRNADPASEYVHNVTGHGYQFVAPVIRQRRSANAAVIRLFGPTVRKAPSWPPVRKNNLPRLMTPVLGRDQAQSELIERVASKRLVTVTGPGGIGKTTAAVVAAEALGQTHADRVCFFDLSEIERPEQIWTQLATVLEMPAATADPQSEILTCLAGLSLLLVLDNCEHVVESATRLAESVLHGCPQARILATSREPLRASGEVVYELTPLGLPAALDPPSAESLIRYPAIRLFVERAGAEVREEELPLVTEICRRLAGNALAIEIAASQCRWLGLKALVAGLDDEMFLSMEGRRTAHARHQTLRASLDWSYGSLSTQEQAIFRRLSQLPGRFSADHAAAVLADEQLSSRLVVRCLVTLARKSLLVTDTSSQHVSYGLHDLTRAYARGKLEEAQQLSFIDARTAQV